MEQCYRNRTAGTIGWPRVRAVGSRGKMFGSGARHDGRPEESFAMTSTALRHRAAALIALAAIALSASGCTKYGCFDYSQEEYDAFGGCPSQEEALEYFGDPNCGGMVASVDSEAEYEDGYCCYEITKNDNDEFYYDIGCQ